MTWQLVYTRQAQKDAKKLAAAGLRRKAEKLLEILGENPFQTPPPYEKLVGDLSGVFTPDQHSTPACLSSAGRRKDREGVENVDALRIMNRDGQDQQDRLPEGWAWTTIGEISEVICGASPRPKGNPRYFGGDIPWIMISDVTQESGMYISKTRDTVTEEGTKKSRYLEAGALILSNRATVCVPKILKVAGCIHDGFVAFPNLTGNVDMHYLYYWFEAIRPKVIQDHRQGVTQVKLNTGIVRDLSLALAPLEEQYRIVAEIEKQFTRLEAGVAALKRVQTNLKRYRALVLKAACEGRLVPTEAELCRLRNADCGLIMNRLTCCLSASSKNTAPSGKPTNWLR